LNNSEKAGKDISRWSIYATINGQLNTFYLTVLVVERDKKTKRLHLLLVWYVRYIMVVNENPYTYKTQYQVPCTVMSSTVASLIDLAVVLMSSNY